MSKSRKRSKVKRKMSTNQERRYLRIIFILVVMSLLWILFAPGAGLFSFFTKRGELKDIEKETTLMEVENKTLEKDIENLLHDPEYLEEVARKDFELLKKNEKVYDFSKEDKKSNFEK